MPHMSATRKESNVPTDRPPLSAMDVAGTLTARTRKHPAVAGTQENQTQTLCDVTDHATRTTTDPHLRMNAQAGAGTLQTRFQGRPNRANARAAVIQEVHRPRLTNATGVIVPEGQHSNAGSNAGRHLLLDDQAVVGTQETQTQTLCDVTDHATRTTADPHLRTTNQVGAGTPQTRSQGRLNRANAHAAVIKEVHLPLLTNATGVNIPEIQHSNERSNIHPLPAIGTTGAGLPLQHLSGQPIVREGLDRHTPIGTAPTFPINQPDSTPIAGQRRKHPVVADHPRPGPVQEWMIMTP
jgi:hypothetical protein